MGKVAVNAEYQATADQVWIVLADFGGLGSWAPGVDSCELEGEGIGSVRSIGMPGGVVMEERLDSLDEAGRTLSYAIIGGPLPVENYVATVKVSEAGGGCRVDWGATFDDPDGIPANAIETAVGGAYSGMLEGLKKHLGEG